MRSSRATDGGEARREVGDGPRHRVRHRRCGRRRGAETDPASTARRSPGSTRGSEADRSSPPSRPLPAPRPGSRTTIPAELDRSGNIGSPGAESMAPSRCESIGPLTSHAELLATDASPESVGGGADSTEGVMPRHRGASARWPADAAPRAARLHGQPLPQSDRRSTPAASSRSPGTRRQGDGGVGRPSADEGRATPISNDESDGGSTRTRTCRSRHLGFSGADRRRRPHRLHGSRTGGGARQRRGARRRFHSIAIEHPAGPAAPGVRTGVRSRRGSGSAWPRSLRA